MESTKQHLSGCNSFNTEYVSRYDQTTGIYWCKDCEKNFFADLPQEKPRTAETMKENFLTRPGDVYVIPVSRRCLSSGMHFRVTNDRTKEDFTISCENKLGVWELFRDLDDMGGRSVVVHYGGDEEPIPFKGSPPYTARF